MPPAPSRDLAVRGALFRVEHDAQPLLLPSQPLLSPSQPPRRALFRVEHAAQPLLSPSQPLLSPSQPLLSPSQPPIVAIAPAPPEHIAHESARHGLVGLFRAIDIEDTEMPFHLV
mmetsp:Transcript_9255/g.20185  ORF Transcript_9255/g.20185 Transcript_9255/m.20185 type:complete len:115 (+) Transcript_9255:671-1015(+)